ncbi:WD repeat-containing protein 6 [Liparis tanakae]|uniref:tRNA (34-2'-O)-methyltransferase regulator WDR6 n=1 Tax=Liparis tanakae TaxID=230148 RepID=A0A4Z2HIA3_9TELE|nr:WD repeat-containing protein 6 [Liparis tanakae]
MAGPRRQQNPRTFPQLADCRFVASSSCVADTIVDVSPMKVSDHQRMETAALVAPVTALEFLQDAFLLTGEGPVLTVFNLHPRPEACASLSVLQHYRIHGIRPRSLKVVPAQRSATGTSGKNTDEASATSEPKFYDLAVFGGKAVRLVRLHVDLQDGEPLRFEILGPLAKLQDWALDVRWLCGHKRSLLCVAVAHNSALLLDIVTGNVLFQRSCLEGCLLYSSLLLVHESWEDTVLLGGTVFNQLVLWKPGGGGDKSVDSKHKAPVERRLLGHSGVIFSISYLQEKGWLASASDDRSEGATQEQKIGDNKRMDEDWLTGNKQTDEGGVEGSSIGELKEERERKGVGDLTLRPLSCLFGVHGKQGVTSVREYQGLLYSTGRDGCVRVFRVLHLVAPGKLEEESNGKGVENKGGLQLEVLRVQRACKGMEWLERVLILESDIPEEGGEEERVEEELGEECENYTTKKPNLTGKLEAPEEREEKGSFRGEERKMENKGREARFAIIGFHAVHFVVWDPVRQERLFAVPCGGGHRSWRLWPSHKGVWPGYGALVFIKQGAVMASQPPGGAPSWAGTVGRSGGWGLREGVHGKGIGCVCRLGSIRGTRNEMPTNNTRDFTNTEGRGDAEEVAREEERWEIVVTGGEDTSLTVLAVRPDSGSVKVLSVITDHISSIRTVTAVTRPEGGGDNQAASLSSLLVSAGGRAQMQCYRLLVGWDRRRLVPTCQVIQVAGHRLDEQWEKKRNRHKTVKADPETRRVNKGCFLSTCEGSFSHKERDLFFTT